MPRFHHHDRFIHHPRRHFGGGLWLIGMGFLFLGGGRWWPVILLLIGLSIILGALSRQDNPPQAEPMQQPWTPPAPPVPSPLDPGIHIPINLQPAPAPSSHRADLLPQTCPQCGGPVRSYDVKWTGNQSAACAYCGANLPMKKS